MMQIRSSTMPYHYNMGIRGTHKIQAPKNTSSSKGFVEEVVKATGQKADKAPTAVTDPSKHAPPLNRADTQTIRSLTSAELEDLRIAAETDSSVRSRSHGDIVELTQEQIKDLQSRYDVTHLSEEEETSLLQELIDLGAISEEDSKKVRIGQTDKRTAGVLRRYDPATHYQLLDNKNILLVLDAFMKDEEWKYQYLEEKYGEDEGTTKVKESLDAHKRLLFVLEQLRS